MQRLAYILLGVVLFLMVAVFFFFNSAVDETSPPSSSENVDGRLAEEIEDMPEGDVASADWRTISLTDVSSGELFTIDSLNDKPILLESFAVWCSICTQQQREIQDFHAEPGYGKDEVVSITLNTDPNEDASLVQDHTERHGFDWYYAVAPATMTQSLIDEFGTGIISAPQAPMILVCPSGEATFLDRGVKDVDELKAAVDSC